MILIYRVVPCLHVSAQIHIATADERGTCPLPFAPAGPANTSSRIGVAHSEPVGPACAGDSTADHGGSWSKLPNSRLVSRAT